MPDKFHDLHYSPERQAQYVEAMRQVRAIGIDCRSCYGTGERGEYDCPVCGGKGLDYALLPQDDLDDKDGDAAR